MYPQIRMRRLRQNILQPMFRETRLVKDELIMPLFFDENAVKPVPIASMPGQFRYPLSCAEEVAEEMKAAGIRAVLLFGIPKCKDTEAAGAFAENGVVQEATRRIKAAAPDLVVITDTCACEYTSHGHCGILCGKELDNDASLLLMEKIAVSQAAAGADMIAPSCMLDGQVLAIREALDEAGFSNTPVMSYSTKFASALYGPFREAADSGFSFGDRTSYQMSPANRREAIRESYLDEVEGADILMVKPAGFYLDILRDVRESTDMPVAAYQVSGEYSMIKAAGMNGWIDEKKIMMESLLAIKRAGADLIITYFAKEAAEMLP
ncbi:porphobilinogen synthase [Methanocorpusculum sp. GPch4]|uniref:porphobilinogen synthase n=1 Tax=Methanocorpusculum sp. GPch4 TaxID=2527877 RepID=UPI0014333FFA|nr:porphobilinogen synthase [Methanocorpusculum sp. GPch4]